MVCIIAEAGVNHCGDPYTAGLLVGAAKGVGADAVKFQIFDARILEPPGPRRDMLEKLQLSHHAFRNLKLTADDLGIEFLATPFDPGSLEFLIGLGVKRIKISSADLRNEGLLKAVAGSGLELILSTGMATMLDIYAAMRSIDWKPCTLLHCTSAYPTPFQHVNLRAIEIMKREYGACTIGLSDHTTSTVIPAAAVAMGAEVIEKHLTLDRDQEGPDHRSSLDLDGFKEMVSNIREVELAMGDGIKRPQPSEANVVAIRKEREMHRG